MTGARGWSLGALVLAVGLWWSCGLDPSMDLTGTRCEADGTCGGPESGYVCVAHLCERPGAVGADAGGSDAGAPDAGAADAGVVDAGVADAGAADAGALDAGPSDAGAVDAGVADAGVVDGGVADAGLADAGAADAGAADAGVADAGSPDGGPTPYDAGLLPDGGFPPAPVLGSNDADSDGKIDELDSCPFFANPGQAPPQWASSATASSNYDATGTTPNYNTYGALGAPDVTSSCGDNYRTWSPVSGAQPEWLQVTFATAVHATGLNVIETYQGGVLAGFVKGVVLIEPNLTEHPVPVTFTDQTVCTHPLALRWAAVPFLVKSVRIITQAAGYEEIDAVGLFSDPCP